MVEGNGRTLDEPDQALIPLSLARKLFGREPATGKLLAERDRTLTVGGVYRDFPRNSSVGNRIYFRMDPNENIDGWGNVNYTGFIRLDAEENVETVFDSFEHSTEFARIRKENIWWQGDNASLQYSPLTGLHFVTDVLYDPTPKSNRQTVLVLFAIAIVIVVIAGINYTNFSAALVPRRIRSINTQKVFGGSTGVIRTALLCEGVVIGFVSFLIGAVLVYLAQDTPLTQLVEADIAPGAHVTLVAATAALSLVAGLLAGLYPSFYITSFPPALVLKGSFGLSRAGRRLRGALTGIQFIASFALIISAAFMFLQNYYMQHAPLGYDRDELIVTSLTARVNNSRDAFTARLKEFAGTADVTYAQQILAGGDWYMGWTRDYHGKQIAFQTLPVDPSFLRATGIRVTEGRDFLEDDGRTRHGALIFNEKARYDHGLVLNERIDSIEIVGFMPDVKFASFRRAVEPMAFYVCGTESWAARPPDYAYLRVKAGADLRAALAHVRASLAAFDDEYAFDVRFFDDVLNHTYEKERQFGTLITLFSLVAIFIAIMGVFGLVIFDSEYRRKEIGIRKVFGSTTREILVRFNKSYVRILVLCFLPAAPLAWYAVARWLENFAYRTPMYWWVYAAAFAAVFVLTVATVTFQNWRAANANPIDSIKSE
jgi:putative ABC transport system permease protein